MILALLAGCVQTVRFQPDLFPNDNWDTGWDTGFVRPAPGPPSSIDPATIRAGCNGADTAISAQLWTSGAAGSATVLFVELGGPRVEFHPMLLNDASPDFQWDQYVLGPLLHGTSPHTSGTSTAFTCGEDDDRMTWAVWTTDRTGAPADCVIWGAATANARDALLSRDPAIPPLCREIGFPNPN